MGRQTRNFSYSQNVQTVILVYTTSSYSYVGNVRRRRGQTGRFSWRDTAGRIAALTANSGTTSSAQRVWSTFTASQVQR